MGRGCLGLGRLSEAFRVSGVGLGEDFVALLQDLLSPPGMDGLGSQIRDPAVVVLGVVPGEKASTEGSGVGQRAEVIGEAGPVLEGLELGLGVGIVVAGFGAGCGCGPRPSRRATGAGSWRSWSSPDRHGE